MNAAGESALDAGGTLIANEVRLCYPAQVAFQYGKVSEVLDAFAEIYTPIHTCTSLIISILGMAANVLTVVMLSRHDMRTPTNRLYALMAAADLVTMLLYAMYAASELFYP